MTTSSVATSITRLLRSASGGGSISRSPTVRRAEHPPIEHQQGAITAKALGVAQSGSSRTGVRDVEIQDVAAPVAADRCHLCQSGLMMGLTGPANRSVIAATERFSRIGGEKLQRRYSRGGGHLGAVGREPVSKGDACRGHERPDLRWAAVADVPDAQVAADARQRLPSPMNTTSDAPPA